MCISTQPSKSFFSLPMAICRSGLFHLLVALVLSNTIATSNANVEGTGFFFFLKKNSFSHLLKVITSYLVDQILMVLIVKRGCSICVEESC